MRELPIYPFDSRRCIGNVLEVNPTGTKVNLPQAATPEGKSFFGNRLGGGEVGEFVFIECGENAIFGRITSVKLPEKERLNIEPEIGQPSVSDMNPFGTVQLLASINLRTREINTGVVNYPRLGCKVYSAHPHLIAWIAETSSYKYYEDNSISLSLAYLPKQGDINISLLPEHIFGRHCAVLGATGGGKSWTIARLIEEAANYNSKIILLDATGEFHKMNHKVRHVHFGKSPNSDESSTEVVFPYTSFTEADLFAIFNPSGQTQVPKLRSAMKSLKLAAIEPSLAVDGVIKKANQSKVPFEAKYREHVHDLEGNLAEFDISRLVRQIDEECVWLNDRSDSTKWGATNENERSYCVSLLSRIESMVSAPELECIFNVEDKASILQEISDFLLDERFSILRISLQYISFAHNAREVLVNALGRNLLSQARIGKFINRPLLVFLDEAHQFLNKSLGDENSRYNLDAFDLIAKEGRKYSLNICISTQRPRDIPEGILSQVGTLIVHRLTNERDREVVERACGDFDKSIASFLPNLVPGEAMIVGVDFPIPVTTQIYKPSNEPDSMGPSFQKHWRHSECACLE